MKRFFFLGLMVVIISACNMTDSGTSIHFPMRFSQNIFPDKIGDYWVYQYDNLAFKNETNETIKVSVVGKGKLPDGEQAKLWKYEYPNHTDTLWVVSNDTVAKIYLKPCFSCTISMPEMLLRYKFPLNKGKLWFTHALYGDTTTVTDQLNVTVPAGTFNDVYKITKTLGYVTNSRTQDTLWYKNNVGLIKKSQFEYSLGPVIGNGYWKLKEFKVQ